ncbi:mersacidin family lantibiotic [Enterococcus sp. LJL99]
MLKKNEENMNGQELLKKFEMLSETEKIETLEKFDKIEKIVTEIDYESLVQQVNSGEVVGGSFEELTEEQMLELQAAGDVNAETSPVCVATAISSLGCGAASVGFIVSLVNC